MIAHSIIARSIPAHSQYLSTLFGSCCSDVSLLVSIAKSSAYGAEVIVILDVPSVYPCFPCGDHRRSDSRDIMNKYGLTVSPWIVPLCIGIFCVWPKCSPVNIVFECE